MIPKYGVLLSAHQQCCPRFAARWIDMNCTLSKLASLVLVNAAHCLASHCKRLGAQFTRVVANLNTNTLCKSYKVSQYYS